MGRNTKVVSSISRKTKLNMVSVIFILFVIISIIFSINPIVSMIDKRNQISSLESKLNLIRKENIEFLALEKSLYEEEMIKNEALKQFNFTSSDDKVVYQINEVDKLKRNGSSINDLEGKEKAIYSNNNLWENLKILYYKEIYKEQN
ncbi:MAG: septum formation initiator family protein [Actinomycetota bacterium]|nr:septum formation initiator family protein [Actinomycetota bacterium]